MSDTELLAILELETRQSIGADDLTSMQRAEMMAYYMGEAKGALAPPAVEGRSQVVSKDMMDTVEWIMPTMMHTFASTDDAVTFQPETERDEQAVRDASDYVGYLFWRKNQGFRVLHDAIKNSLMQRVSYVKVYCDDSWDQRIERYNGISGMDLEILKSDPDVEVISIALAEDVPTEDPNDGVQVDKAYNVQARRKEKRRNHRVIGVPPEEMRLSKASRSVEDARFIQQQSRKTISELLSLGFDKAKVLSIPAENNDVQYALETRERGFYDNTLLDYSASRLDESQRTVELREAYLRVDYDGDGIAEFRKVVYASRVIFENEEVDDHPFALFSPILMPFKAIGLGIWDLCEDLQRIRTVLTRQMLDNAYLANNPQKVVVESQVNLDDLLNPRPNGVIRAQTLEAIRTEAVPFIGPQALTLLDHFGQMRDRRTGVSDAGTMLNPEALQKTDIGSQGAQQMMDAAAMRVELIARVFAETGLSRVWQLLLKLAVQYAERDEQVKVNGRWLHINPREWKDRYETCVNIGAGTTNKQQRLQNAMLILQTQANPQAAEQGLVTPENAYEALTVLVEAMGFKDVNRFFTNPANAPPKQEGPPPEVQLEMLKQQGAQQLAQVKAQADIQVEQMKQQFQAEDSRLQKELEAQRDALKLQNDKEMAQYKAELEMEQHRMKLEADIVMARINAEAKILSAKTMGAKDSSTADADADYQEQHEGLE